MTDLIKVDYESDRPTVLARDLHKELEITERFSSWFTRMCSYGFDENSDYIGCKTFNTLAHQELQDYQITIDMAKEIAMLQRTERGKQIRKQLIELEKAWYSPEQVMARALQVADRTIKQLTLVNQQQEQQIAEMKPKVNYVDTYI